MVISLVPNDETYTNFEPQQLA